MAKVDVAIVGAGLAGLATALAILEKEPSLEVVVLSPGATDSSTHQGFGSNQPAIASHPHFSKDHNLLSQWTSFCLPENDRVLSAAYRVNPSIVVARGRWQVARSPAEALDLRHRIEVFNSTIPNKLQAQWCSDTGSFGALWLPGAWAISPPLLRQVWIDQLMQHGCMFIDSEAEKLVIEKSLALQYEAQKETSTIEAASVVLCSSICLHALLDQNLPELPLKNCLPLVQWPGQSQKEVCVERSEIYGATTVQNEGYAIALGNNEWLIRDENQTAAEPFRGDRWHTPDRLPYLGAMFDLRSIAADAARIHKNDLLPLPSLKNVFINTAHGTRGLLSSIAGAAVIADMLLRVNTSVPQALATALNPNRYIRRGLRQHVRHLQSSNRIL